MEIIKENTYFTAIVYKTPVKSETKEAEVKEADKKVEEPKEVKSTELKAKKPYNFITELLSLI